MASTKDPSISEARKETESPSVKFGALYLIFIQISSRLLTFVGNQFLLRYISPTLLGLAVQLEVLSVTILYSSRESLRVALQREPIVSVSGQDAAQKRTKASLARDSSQSTVNIAYLVLIVGCANLSLLGYGYLQNASDEVLSSTDFGLAVKIYAVATLIELCAEPSFVIIQQLSLYKARARAETLAAICKCLGACLSTVVISARYSRISVLPFAIGQLIYAVVLMIMYQMTTIPLARSIGFAMSPRQIQSTSISSSSSSQQYFLGYFFKPLLWLATTFYTQSILKLLLTQGDSLILSFVADLRVQGAFALASNYGGLLSRLLFQPIEESSRSIFGRLLAPVSQGTNATTTDMAQTKETKKGTSNSSINNLDTNTTSSPSESDQKEIPDNKSSNVDLALNHLTTTLHLYNLFSLPLLTILPHIFPALISTVIGSRWSTQATSSLLSAYAYYLPFLAVNGILDAFVTSVASPRDLQVQGVLMTVVTLIYGGFAWVAMADANSPIIKTEGLWFLSVKGLGLGPAGLVWANILNMSLRITYSVWFISAWFARNYSLEVGRAKSFKEKPYLQQGVWRNCLPHGICITTAIAVGTGLQLTMRSGPEVVLADKRFFFVKGLDVNDIGSVIASVLVLGSSILLFEYQFFISTVMAIVPERLASKIKPYLPKS